MGQYRKKPVVIEAFQLTEENKDQVFNWITCTRLPSFDDAGKPAIVIRTLEGDMKALIGDYIIKGVNGEFYPCKPEIFEATYEHEPAPSKEYQEERRSGRTTRIVDGLIQQLFRHGKITVGDHDAGDRRFTLALVKDRLHREHERVKWISDREDPFTIHLERGLTEKEIADLKNEY